MGRQASKLRDMLIASREAGFIVAGVKTEGDKIELVYETTKDTLPADLINWKRQK